MKYRAVLMSLLSVFALSAFGQASAPEGVKPPASLPGGLFVAVGYGGFRGWSEDGENWTAQRWSDKNADDPNIIFGLTYRDGIFLASGGGVGKGFILRSVDGKQWDEVVNVKWRISPLLALKDRFISVFNDHFQESADGKSWTELANAKTVADDGIGGGYFRRWAAGNGAVVVAGDYALPNAKPRVGWIGGSKNGHTDLKIQKQSADVCGLAFANGVFVAETKDGHLLISKDGLNFEQAARDDDQHDDDSIRFHEGRFYSVGRKGMQSSTDGEHWSAVEHPPRIPRAVGPNGTCVDCGWGGLQFSSDGKTFHKAKVPVDQTGVCTVMYGVPRANLPRPANDKR